MNNPFFAMDTAFFHPDGRYTPRARAQMLAELGYAGTCCTLWDQRAWDDLPVLLKELDKVKLTLFTIYLPTDIADPEEAIDERLAPVLKLLEGRPTLIELELHSSNQHDRSSSSRADGRAAKVIRQLAELARNHNVGVSLYPHTGSWLERTEDAVRLLMRVNQPDIGMTFNLWHWLNVDGSAIADRLHLAGPRLRNLTINGASRDKQGGYATLHRLDSGTFDLFAFLCNVHRIGYTGPIGLQGYGLWGDVYCNLRASMAAWRDLSKRVANHSDWGKLDPPVEHMRIRKQQKQARD